MLVTLTKFGYQPIIQNSSILFYIDIKYNLKPFFMYTCPKL